MENNNYQKLVENLKVGFAFFKVIREKNNKVDYIFLDVNKEFEKITKLRKKKIIGEKASTLLHEFILHDYDDIEDILRGTVSQSRHYIDHLDKWYQKTTHCLEKDTIVIILSDITEQVKLENKLEKKLMDYETIYNNMNDGVFLINVKGNDFILTSSNDAFGRLEDINNKKLNGKSLLKDLAEKMINSFQRCGKEKKNIVFEEEVGLPGRKKYLQTSLSPVIKDDRVFQIVGVSRDITKIKKVQEKLNYFSFHDSLTGLYNRSYFEDILKRYDVERKLPISMILGDVNGLKLTNDGFGHQAGDKLLITVSAILKQCCRKDDIIARWGGDEFVVLLPGTSEDETKEIVENIERKISGLESYPIKLSIAMGYATKTNKDENIKTVFKKAEDWMYKKKLVESRNVHSNIISSLKETLYQSSHENFDHCQRLKDLSIKTGRSLGLPESEIIDLGLVAELHDLGKVGISNSILEKKGKLSSKEREKLNKHPEIGYQIAKSSPQISHIAEYLLHHHENWDGTGFPYKLKGNQIPYLSRIISVINKFDKLTNYHPRTKTVSKEEATEILKKEAGKKFDPDIVNVFVEKVIGKKEE